MSYSGHKVRLLEPTFDLFATRRNRWHGDGSFLEIVMHKVTTSAAAMTPIAT